jgi:hypothetical protein
MTGSGKEELGTHYVVHVAVTKVTRYKPDSMDRSVRGQAASQLTGEDRRTTELANISLKNNDLVLALENAKRHLDLIGDVEE